MAVVKPFKCVRPNKEVVDKVAALPYDVYNRKEAKQETLREPLSFLKIDRAESQFDDSVDTYDPRVYVKAKEMFEEEVAKGIYEEIDEAYYYIYELTMDGRSQTGIVATASIDDYLNNTIKKHENTRADKELDRINHVDVMSAQTGPIFLAYRENKTISEEIAKTKENQALYDFTSNDGIRHRVWVIDDKDSIKKIQEAFANIRALYIADGHHRCASAVKVGLKRREAHPNYTGKEEFNYFLSVLFPDEELMIMDYNRVVKDLNGLSSKEFLDKLSTLFDIEEEKHEYKPKRKATFGMYLDKKWYKLTAKVNILSNDPVDGLDVAILQNNVLDPILGIKDPKTDKRIDFVGGIRGLKELERRCNSDMKLAFSMFPTSIQELFDVADAKLLMPPKSTWFEPKLRSGLFIHRIEK
ncbi:MAG: DUF1015 domain-containing protein [Acholeplasmatales bacterium]|nr:DUF1015 domain-containing protein [Acholeplasmatales bacterium]